MRTCPSCGEVKDDADFWSGARRCRKCVAVETAQRRSARAASDRAAIKAKYGLKISLSGRKYRQFELKANQQAESVVPKTRRDHLATASIWAGRLFVALCLLLLFGGWERPIIVVVAAGGGAFTMFRVADWLGRPRRTSVKDVADAVLRGNVSEFQDGQLEYLRFYTTVEWRDMRAVVIDRDGALCRACGCRIVNFRDITVDHIKPRSRFPHLALARDNLQVLCRQCNSSKGAR